MAYRIRKKIGLGSNRTGLTLKGQLYDSAGATVGSEITTGFTELGGGDYEIDHSNCPDGFIGRILVYTGTLPSGYRASTTISPADAIPSAVAVVPPSAAQIASAVRTELDTNSTKLALITSLPSAAQIAAAVEAAVINETDGNLVLKAITDKIASVNPSLGDLTLDAIAARVWTNATRSLTAAVSVSGTVNANLVTILSEAIDQEEGTLEVALTPEQKADLVADVVAIFEARGVTLTRLQYLDAPVSEAGGGEEVDLTTTAVNTIVGRILANANRPINVNADGRVEVDVVTIAGEVAELLTGPVDARVVDVDQGAYSEFGVTIGTVAANATLMSFIASSNLRAEEKFYANGFVTFLSGGLTGQSRLCVTYSEDRKVSFQTPLTKLPQPGDVFMCYGRSESV